MRRLIPILATISALSLFGTLPASAAGISKSEVQSKALSLSNMPTGWSVDHISGSASNLGGCLSGLAALQQPVKGIVQAKVNYDDQSEPSLQELLDTGKGAATRFQKYVKVINSCRSFSYSSHGIKFTGTAGPMSFPAIGSESSAYEVNVNAGVVTANIGVVLFKAGQYFVNLVYEDTSTDASVVQAFAQEALAKVEGKPTTPSTTF